MTPLKTIIFYIFFRYRKPGQIAHINNVEVKNV